MPEGKTKPLIPPTTGRRVLVFMATQPPGATPYDAKKPYDGGIAYAWGESDPECNTINVGFRDHAGIAHSATSVRLFDRAQDETDQHGHPDRGNYAVWMAYQFEQAKRAAEPKVSHSGVMGAIGAVAETLDMNALKTHDNGVPVRDPEPYSEPKPEGDAGVLEGTNRTTDGSIGQP